MASRKLAYGTPAAMTVTNLHSNTSSATNVWCSAAVDNTSNLYVDALVHVKLDFANTSPANSKACFIYAYASIDNSTFTQPASGSEGDQTVVDFTTNAIALIPLGILPYTTADEIVEAGPFSVAQAFGGTLPPYWGVAIINHSGATLHSSGNEVKYVEVYETVA